jgi:hypothetical protein
MAYEQKDNSGSMFIEDVGNTNRPNFKGSIRVKGEDYWISGWNNVSKNGKEFISLSVQDKKEVHSKGVAATQKTITAPANTPINNTLESAWDDDTDQINF